MKQFRHPMIFVCAMTVCCLIVPVTIAQENVVSYTDLVSRLTTMELLARLPGVGEISGEATSYDRASKYDEATGKYVNWDANGDGGGVIERYPDGRVLMADLQGPGFINHIWSALPKEGHVKIYIDGNETPVVDLPFADYFSRKVAPFNREALCYKTTANGENNWVPIPFQKSCRIVADPEWGSYYYFHFVQFPEGTTVPTFSMNLDAEANAALDRANARLMQCGPGRETREAPMTFSLPKNGGKREFVFEESQAFARMLARLELPEDDVECRDILRGVTISIYWDGQEEPAVWVPIGDFFGVVCQRASCLGFPTGLSEDNQFYNHWYMPFKSARIVLQNDNDVDVTFNQFHVRTVPLRADIANYGRFHAKWHRNAFLPDSVADPQRWIDWTILATRGRGKYVGVSLHIENFRGGWWGEGDEKFFIDGEKFPSYFGTGSEDYFGYAWSSANRFVQAFHSQPTNTNNRYFVVNNRWHITDAVRFQKSFDGYIEKYYRDDKPCLYAATAFWYMEPGGIDPYKPLPLSERTGYYIDNIVYHKMPEGGIRDRDLMPRQRPENLSEQDMGGFSGEWEGDRQLWWRPGRVGETVKLRLPAPSEGKFKLSARMTTARDYGIHQFAVNGTNVGTPVDLYTEEVRPTDLKEIGVVELKKGDNEMELTVTGRNEKSSGYLLGIDYVVLTPVE